MEQRVFVGVRMLPGAVTRLDELARECGVTRSRMLRELLRKGLSVWGSSDTAGVKHAGVVVAVVAEVGSVPQWRLNSRAAYAKAVVAAAAAGAPELEAYDLWAGSDAVREEDQDTVGEDPA